MKFYKSSIHQTIHLVCEINYSNEATTLGESTIQRAFIKRNVSNFESILPLICHRQMAIISSARPFRTAVTKEINWRFCSNRLSILNELRIRKGTSPFYKLPLQTVKMESTFSKKITIFRKKNVKKCKLLISGQCPDLFS